MSGYVLEKAGSGAETLCFEQDGGRIYLHSRFDPRREAADLLKNYPLLKHDFIVLLGNGLGYVKEALSRYQHIKKVFVVEKEKELFRIYLQTGGRDDGSFLVDRDPDGVVSAIVPLFDLLEYRGFLLIELPSVVNRQKEYYGEIKRKLICDLEKSVNNQLTESRLGAALINAFFRNWALLRDARLVRPEREKPPRGDLVICAAGPSLVRDIPSLQKIGPSCSVLAVDTALPYLLKNGIHPDAVFSMDPQYFSYLHFYQQEFGGMKIFDFFSGALPANRGALPALLVTGNFISRALFPEEDIFSFQGGSITNLVFQMFRDSASRIVFSGLDLGVSSHAVYVPHSYLNPYFLKRNSRFRPLADLYFNFYLSRSRREVRYGNEPVRTASSMAGYYSWLVSSIPDFSKVYFSRNCLARHEKIGRIDLEELVRGEKREPLYRTAGADFGRIKKRLKTLLDEGNFLMQLTRAAILSRHLEDWKELGPDERKEQIRVLADYLQKKLRLLLKDHM